ncbi:hypothetical protein AB1L88_22900 [Tautonia sp. JC769]|uniref:hypothetical protein n=1 Tax=Tautonia sp. JC769 TaxID=3232135 RepID=UPI003459B8FE
MRRELVEVLAIWSASHEQIRQGDRAFSRIRQAGEEAQDALDRLQPSFATMRDAATLAALAVTGRFIRWPGCVTTSNGGSGDS